MATGAADGLVRIFDIRTLAHVHTFTGHPEGKVTGLTFSENGYYLASVSEKEDMIRIWDLRKLTNVGNIEVVGGVKDVVWDMSGMYIAALIGNEVRYS